MFTDPPIPLAAKDYHQPKLAFQVGDLVSPRTDRATVCEVLGPEDEDRIRVRGLDWPPGYSAMLPAAEIYLVLRVDSDKLERAG